jgi:hypothetical protein
MRGILRRNDEMIVSDCIGTADRKAYGLHRIVLLSLPMSLRRPKKSIICKNYIELNTLVNMRCLVSQY